MDLKSKLIKLLEHFNKQSFKDVEVDGTIYRLSTEAIEVGTTVSVVTMDEAGNEVETAVEDNTWTIEGVTFRTEGGVIVEIMEEVVVEEPAVEDATAVDEVLFSEEDMSQLLGIIDLLVSDINMLKDKIYEVEGAIAAQGTTITEQVAEMQKISAEFSKKPSNNGLPRLFKTKENIEGAVNYAEIAKKYLNK